MGTRAVVETRQDRKALVADAGYRPLSMVGVLAGAVTAYGAFAVLAGVATGVIGATGADVDLAARWGDQGVAGALVVAGLLLAAYLCGGYVAGRMARRSGLAHGAAVFVVGVVLAAACAWSARRLGGADVAADNLRNLGLPTTSAEWRDVATLAGAASLVAMLVGSLVGAVLGDRWHDLLLRRALDPRIGPAAQAQRDSERRAAQAEELRTGSYQRVRAASPTRTRRVDRAADTDDDGVLDPPEEVRTPADTRIVEPLPLAGAWRDRPDRSAEHSSFWWGHSADDRRHGNIEVDEDGNIGVDEDRDTDADRVDPARSHQPSTDRPTARSGGRTG